MMGEVIAVDVEARNSLPAGVWKERRARLCTSPFIHDTRQAIAHRKFRRNVARHDVGTRSHDLHRNGCETSYGKLWVANGAEVEDSLFTRQHKAMLSNVWAIRGPVVSRSFTVRYSGHGLRSKQWKLSDSCFGIAKCPKSQRQSRGQTHRGLR